jgi:uncharacterized membrane protein (UPF0136 family)
MNAVVWTLSIYSLLLMIGGLMGYLKAGSLISLIMGVGAGLVLGYCTWSYHKGNRLQCMLVIGITSAVTLFFAVRFFQSYKLFPPGVMAVVGLIVLGILYKNRPEKC